MAVFQQNMRYPVPLCSSYNFSALTLLVGYNPKSVRPANPNDEVLAWLAVWSEVQMICIWSSWCHCHPIISCFIKFQNGFTFLMPAYTCYPGKEDVKWEFCFVCSEREKITFGYMARVFFRPYALPVAQPTVSKQLKESECNDPNQRKWSTGSSFLHRSPDVWGKRRCRLQYSKHRQSSPAQPNATNRYGPKKITESAPQIQYVSWHCARYKCSYYYYYKTT